MRSSGATLATQISHGTIVAIGSMSGQIANSPQNQTMLLCSPGFARHRPRRDIGDVHASFNADTEAICHGCAQA
jgi:hypothetical protein